MKNEDEDAVLALNDEFFNYSLQFDQNLSEKTKVETEIALNWRIHDAHHSKPLFVALEKDELIGYVAGELSANKNAELQNIFISKSYRGMGKGQKLARRFIEYSRSRAVKKIIVLPYIKDQNAIDFYQKKLGFISEGVSEILNKEILSLTFSTVK